MSDTLSYENLQSIFAEYKFEVQQIVSNNSDIQAEVDREQAEATPDVVNLLGLQWQRNVDKINAARICLNSDARTKREILRTVASQYDLFNFQGPCLNRARIFLHQLQCNKDYSWDDTLSPAMLAEWNKIVKQANRTPIISVERNFGDRSDPYELICFSDASRLIYAAVLYIKNMRTGKVTLVGAKNRFVNSQLQTKTVPSLELQAITLGVEYMLDTMEELSGSKCVLPINIRKLSLYSDSTISLNWLNSFSHY